MKKIYLALHLTLMLYAVGGIFSKRASAASFLSAEYIANYVGLLVILVVYAFFWQKILKVIPLTVAMANKSVTVIWGIVYGCLIFQEKVTIFNIVGAVVMMAGICLVAGAEKEEKETAGEEKKTCT